MLFLSCFPHWVLQFPRQGLVFVWSPTHSGCLECACLEPIWFSTHMSVCTCDEQDWCRSQAGWVLLHSDEKPQVLEGKLCEDTALTVWFCLLHGEPANCYLPRRENEWKQDEKCKVMWVHWEQGVSVVWFFWFRITFVLFLVVVILFSR